MSPRHANGNIICKVDGGQEFGRKHGNWCCIDWQTGKTDYEEHWADGVSKGSIISADGKLFCYDEKKGMVALVNATPAKFDIVSQFRITKGSGPYWAHMSIDNGILYLRHGELFAAYKIK